MTLLFAAMLIVIGLVVVALYFAGASVSIHTTARLCLWERIKAAELAASVPATCVNAIADQQSEPLARIARRGGSEALRARTLLLARLDASVRAIGDYVTTGEVGNAPEARAVVELLERHAVARGGVNRPPAPLS